MTKKLLLLTTLLALPVFAGDFEEQRELSLDTGGIESFKIDATSGLLELSGRDDIDQIIVKANIKVEQKSSWDEGDVKDYLANNLTLSLTEKNGRAHLVAEFSEGMLSFSNINRVVDLVIEAPSSLKLDIDDGSGSITIDGFSSGVNIDDGSGSITLSELAGDVYITDGSGSISLTDSDGAVTIDDGSGSLALKNIKGDVSVEDGSGGIIISDVTGSVSVDDGSGSIVVSNVSEDFTLIDDGSGGVSLTGIQGQVKGYREKHRGRDLQ